MGLLDKLKNAFFEEEYVEVDEHEEVAKKVEPKKVEKKAEPSASDEIKNRTKVVEEDEELEELNETIPEIEEMEYDEPILSDRELVTKNSKIEYFNDSDFVANDYYKEEKKEVSRPYGGVSPSAYNVSTSDKKVYGRPYSASSDRGFQPTPIISPIYGVLDKNYRKEEVIDKKDRPSSYVSKKNADLDSVRQKAYGFNKLDDIPDYDDIVNDRVLEESFKEDFKDDTLLDDIVEENKPVVDQVSIADAEQYFEDLGLEYNVDYKDGVYEKANGRRTEIHEYDDERTQEIIINNNIDKDNYKDEPEEESDLLEDNLFDIVDSVYNGDEE